MYGMYPEANAKDPTGAMNNAHRMVRGGAWGNEGIDYCRSAFRLYYLPDFRNSQVGFRVVRRPGGTAY
jgi:formylglycine-generating enzyme required for sulfatase activity